MIKICTEKSCKPTTYYNNYFSTPALNLELQTTKHH